MRCPNGHCDLVIVDLRDGLVRPLAAGDLLTSFARPRWSPDGRSIAVAMQRDNRWRIAVISADGGLPHFVDPEDGANRFDPSWIAPSSLVDVSDGGGTPNLERIDFGGPAAPVARALTRVTGAAIAPEPNAADGSIWFLSLHSRGYDVRRLASPSPLADQSATPLLNSHLLPVVVQPTSIPRVFAASRTSSPVTYDFGPRTTRWFPAAAIGTTGREATLALINSDVVGRLSLLAQGALGSGDAWHGGSIEGVWRGLRPELRLTGFIERSDSRAFSTVDTSDERHSRGLCLDRL